MDAAVEMYFISVRFSFPQHYDRYCLFLYTGDKTHQLLVCHKMKNKMKKIINNSLCQQRNRSFGKCRGDSSLLTRSKEEASITALQIPPRCLHRLPPSDFCVFLQQESESLTFAEKATADIFYHINSKCTVQTLRAHRNELTPNHAVVMRQQC